MMPDDVMMGLADKINMVYGLIDAQVITLNEGARILCDTTGQGYLLCRLTMIKRISMGSYDG
jgi:hypothetical protein